jgi:hypothetical protein
MTARVIILATAMAAALASSSSAGTYYAAPAGTAVSGAPDGSQAHPWTSLSTALSSVKGGDVLLLKSGNYDGLTAYNRSYDKPVTISSADGKGAHLQFLYLTGSTKNLTFKNLSVWPSNPSSPKRSTLVEALSSTSNILLDGLDVRSGSDAGNYAGWSQSTWKSRAFNAVRLRGAQSTVQNSNITGIGFGIQMLGVNARVLGNTVRGFADDGIRALGANSLIKGNLVTDNVQVNSNHNDGFQSWSQNGVPVKNLTIADNRFIEWSNPVASPLRAQMQGIGLFDGFYDDLAISNNLVSVTAWHGLSVYGGRGVQIVGNTVVNGLGEVGRNPWIGVFDKKSGAHSTDVVLAYNKAMQYTGSSLDLATRIGNSVIQDPMSLLTDPTLFGNLQPQPGQTMVQQPSPLVDPSGTPTHVAALLAPQADLRAPSPVPLPTGGVMLLSALGALGLAWRRRRAAG